LTSHSEDTKLKTVKFSIKTSPMSKENKSGDIVQQYTKEKNLSKLRDILEASKKKVKELEKAVAQVEEEKLLEAYRTGDKSYIKKVLNEMNGESNNNKGASKKEESEKSKEEWDSTDGFTGY